MGNIRNGYGYARLYCGTRFDDDELLSIVYKAMMAAARRFQPGGQSLVRFAKPFIRGELHRAWKNNRPLGQPLTPACDSKATCPDDDPAPVAAEGEFVMFDFGELDAKYNEEKVKKMLRRLSKHERAIVDLVFWGGLSYTDVAKLTRSHRQSVHQVVRNAFSKLKRLAR
jgi:RNA polymerase sigma factor (sigma-70 family)